MTTADAGVALIGLGEVGRVFAEDLRAHGLTDIRAVDIAFGDPHSHASANAAALGVPVGDSPAAALSGASLVVCAVTASQSVRAAEAAAEHLSLGAWFLDINSSSPGHKVAAAAAVNAAGGRYVEAALMSPIHPLRLRSPFYFGGPDAAEFFAVAPSCGITGASVAEGPLGTAAATKLCRSVIVKGLESLFAESLLAARTYGVEREVLASLPNILPDGDWERIAGYFISRSVQHGTRRAEEMEEAAATVREAGVDPWMSEAAVLRQRWAAQFPGTLSAQGTVPLVDALLAASAATKA